MTTYEIVSAISQRGNWGYKLAELWYVSDSSNKMLIETTWRHIFKLYDPNFEPGINRGT